MKALLLGVMLAFSLGFHGARASQEIFLSLPNLLSLEQQQRIADFPALVAQAGKGNVESQIDLAMAISQSLRMDTFAAWLVEAVYEENGFMLDNLTAMSRSKVLRGYRLLAEISLDFRYDEIDPAKGLALLTGLARHPDDPTESRLFLADFLAYGGEYHFGQGNIPADFHVYTKAASVLPPTQNLAAIWRTYSDDLPNPNLNIVHATDALEDFNVNKISKFGLCENALGKTNEIASAFDRIQEQLIADGIASPEEVDQAYDQLDSIAGNSLSAKVQLGFENVPWRAMLSLVLMGDSNVEVAVKDSTTIPLPGISVNAASTPVYLVASKMATALELEFRCRDDQVLVVMSGIAQYRSSYDLNVSFVTEVSDSQSAEGEDITTLVWSSGFTYEGQVKDLVPNGVGVLQAPVSDGQGFVKKGRFVNGQLNGFAEQYRRDGSYWYKGDLQDGLPHGEGHLKIPEDLVDFHGRFEGGEFYGAGSYYYGPWRPVVDVDDQTERDSLEDVYIGPIRAGVPHGTGTCHSGGGQHRCTFFEGVAVGFENISLVPGFSTLPSF
ncbi:MAG: hypothetical protein AB8B96_13355 [Lysobacterales bacterium]